MADSLDLGPLIAALADTRKPLAHARGLPGACYVPTAIHAAEQEQLFAASWLAIAREADLPDAGSFVTRPVGAERILIVRGDDGVLRAFYNVCRHRGSRLVEAESGQLRGAIACPYHPWSYAVDGRQRQAPRRPGPPTPIAPVPSR